MGNDAMRQAWRRLAGETGRAQAVGAELLARYGEPHRRYHDLAHLRAVLAGVDALAGHCLDADAVRLAAWFHDAVYEGVPGRDEEDSARLAERRLPGGEVTPTRVAEGARLVRLTASHAPEPGDADGEVLCDADLAVLGGEPRDYRAYAEAVRAEYAHVREEHFARVRAGILEGLLEREHLFRTPQARDLWQERARVNLRTELAELRRMAGPGPRDLGPA
jgi:predicted metal-dependent HD superfamily phosphohydrolase